MNRGVEEPHTEATRGRSDLSLEEMRVRLEHRVKLTYHSRLQTAKRMQARSITWNTLLVASALTVTIISIVQLVEPDSYGPRGPVALVLVGIASLVASLLVTSANYSARSEVFFRGYRELQRLWAEVARAGQISKSALANLENQYQQLLDKLPNHSEADFRIAFPPTLTRKDKAESGEQSAPFESLTMGPYLAAKTRVYASNMFTFLPVLISMSLFIFLAPATTWLLS